MPGWGEAAFDAYLPAEMVLGHADIAVVVTDRLGNILYVNEFAAGLFRVSGEAARLAGCPVESLGLFAGDGTRQAEDVAGQVLRGRSWEGTFESVRGDGSRGLVRAFAVPLRHPGGDIDGMVILAREAGKRAGIQPGREVILMAGDDGVRVTAGDAMDAISTELPAQIAAHIFVSISSRCQTVAGA